MVVLRLTSYRCRQGRRLRGIDLLDCSVPEDTATATTEAFGTDEHRR